MTSTTADRNSQIPNPSPDQPLMPDPVPVVQMRSDTGRQRTADPLDRADDTTRPGWEYEGGATLLGPATETPADDDGTEPSQETDRP